MIINKLREIVDCRQFLRFALVGVVNTGVFYIVYLILLRIGLGIIWAASAGQIMGAINSYFLNRIFTFRIRKHGTIGEKIRFIFVSIGQYFVSVGLIWSAVYFVGIIEELAGVFGVAGSVIVGYLGHRFWTFRGME